MSETKKSLDEIVSDVEGQKIEYVIAPLSEVIPEVVVQESKSLPGGKFVLKGFEVGGKKLKVSERAHNSLLSRFGLSPSIFSVYSPAEVFERLIQRRGDTNLRWAYNAEEGRALAITNPLSPVVTPDELVRVLRHTDRPADTIEYEHGVFTTGHTVGAVENISGYEFQPRFSLEIPLDGYGEPSFYLMFERLVCTNLAVARDRAFKTSLSLGKLQDDNSAIIRRAVDSFGNEAGFDALYNRLNTAATTVASVREVYQLRKLFANAILHGMNISTLLNRYEAMTGDIGAMFHAPNIHAIPPRRQTILSMRCTVADLINFATELSTHYSFMFAPGGLRAVNGWVGMMLTQNFDLEELDGIHTPEQKDFYIGNLGINEVPQQVLLMQEEGEEEVAEDEDDQ